MPSHVPTPVLACLVPLLAAAGCARCGGDAAGGEPFVDDESVVETEGLERVDLKGTRPGTVRDGEVDPACLAFCEKANSCAEADGRPIPEGARPCERACAARGLYKLAPPSALACAPEPCGTFHACAERALIAHARASDLPVFPRKCEGLCHKLAWCAERLGEPSPETADCDAACVPGGAVAAVPRPGHGCVDAPCGADMARCLASAGTPPDAVAALAAGASLPSDAPTPAAPR